MFETLKKKSFKNTAIISAILIIAGVVILAFAGRKALYAVTGYAQFEELAPDQIKNQLVDIDLVENWGCFLEEYEENTSTHRKTTTDYYYVIYTGSYDDLETDYKFMTIKVPAKFGSKMDEMSDNTYNGILSSAMSFSGEIKTLDEEEYGYFVEFWEEVGYTESEIEELTLPYYINTFASKTGQNVMYIVFFCAGVFLLVWGVLRIIKASTGSYLSKIRQDIASIGCTEGTVESDFNSAVSYTKKDDFKIGRLFIYYNLNSSIPRAIPASKICWAYQNTTTHRTNGIKTGTTYSLMFYVEGSKNARTFNVPSEAVSQESLKLITGRFPWVVTGYTEDLRKMYNKNRAEFLNLRYNTVEHTAVEPGMEGFSSQFSTTETQGL